MRTLLSLLAVTLLCTAPAHADVLIGEIYYDHPGADDGFEWIELFNTGPAPVDLDGYLIGAGGTDYTYSVTTLSGVIGACETFVIGVNSVPENGSPAIDLVVDFDPDLQNSGASPAAADGIALFAPGSDPAVDCPLDAFVYGFDNLNALIDESCTAQAPDFTLVPSGASVQRTSLAGNWLAAGTPGPNDIFLIDFACDPVATESEAWGTVKGWFDRTD